MVRPTSIKLDDELKERIQCIAEAHRRSVHWIMLDAIEQYVEREERRETFKQDCLKAWENYQETTLHSRSEDVYEWVNSWGSENELQAPICRK